MVFMGGQHTTAQRVKSFGDDFWCGSRPTPPVINRTKGQRGGDTSAGNLENVSQPAVAPGLGVPHFKQSLMASEDPASPRWPRRGDLPTSSPGGKGLCPSCGVCGLQSYASVEGWAVWTGSVSPLLGVW